MNNNRYYYYHHLFKNQAKIQTLAVTNCTGAIRVVFQVKDKIFWRKPYCQKFSLTNPNEEWVILRSSVRRGHQLFAESIATHLQTSCALQISEQRLESFME